MDRKLGGTCPFEGGGAGFPSNTMWPGPRPTCIPSFILIRPIVWPQYTNVTDRQTDRQDNGPIAQGEPFYKRSPKKEDKRKNGERGEAKNLLILSLLTHSAHGVFYKKRAI